MDSLPYPRILRHAAAGESEALFALAAQRIGNTVGYRLLTILVPEASGRKLHRLYTTDAESYPLGPADEVTRSAWFVQLFEKRQPVIAADPDAIAAWLPNFEGVSRDGLGALANVPIIVADETIGIINLMDSPRRYGPDTAWLLRQELPLLATAIAVLTGRNGNA